MQTETIVSPSDTARPPAARAGGPLSSLRARLLALVALALSPAFALIVWMHLEHLQGDRATIVSEARRIAATHAAEFGDKIAETGRQLAILASLPVVRDSPRLPVCSEVLARMHRELPHYGNIGLATMDGKVACSAQAFDPARPPQVSDRLWYRRALEARGFAMGEHLVGRVTGRHSLTFGRPVPNAHGELVGVAFAAFDLAWLSRFVADLPLPAGSTLQVLDSKGRILARHPDHEAWVGKAHPRGQSLLALAAGKEEGAAESVGMDGRPRLYAFAHVPGTEGELTVFFGLSSDAADAEARRRLAASLAGMALILLSGFALAWLAAEALVLRRARRLSEAAGRLASGDLGARSGIDAPDEIGRLAAAFDGMAEAVEERERLLNRANRALRIINACNRELLKSADEATLLSAICRHMVSEGGYRAAWVGRRVEDEARSIEYVTGDGIDAELEAAIRLLTWADTPAGHGPVGTALREQRTVITQNTLADALFAPWRELAAARGLASAAALPIRLNGELWGAVALYAGETDAFSVEEAALLAQAADDLSIGLAALQAQARERAAQEASRFKSEFLASMSHELRTPLNAIIGFSEVLRDGLAGELAPGQKEFAADIFNSGEHLLELINDILDLSKVEAGMMTLEQETVDVSTLVNMGLAIVREKATSHHIRLHAKVDAGLRLVADLRKCKQILYNLLSNAVKFTSEGGEIRVHARRIDRDGLHAPIAAGMAEFRIPLPESGADGFLELTVADTGIGVPAEELGRLFQPFVQLDSSLARKHQGTGLGLAMVRRLAELHGGTVGVASREGGGTVFAVWLPLREEDAVAPAPAPRAAISPEADGAAKAAPRVLVVEDNDRATLLLRTQLENEGFAVRHVRSAEEALDLLAREQPDVISLDILLPGMDGWEFLERIKASPKLADIPVVIVSIVAEARQGFALGAAQVLQKPVTREALAAAMSRIGFRPEASRATVLVVDDDPAAVTLLAAHLEASGYAAQRAFGGGEAIETTRHLLPDLILLDLLMPEVSGFDVVEALKRDPRTAQIPIIVVTSKEITPEDRAALNGNVEFIMSKSSFSQESFINEVRRSLKRRKAVPPYRGN